MVVSLTGGSTGTVPILRTAVYVDGALLRDVLVRSVQSHQGARGATADLELPLANYKDADALTGKEVEIYFWHDGEGAGPPRFRGLCLGSTGVIADNENMRGARCVSWLGMMGLCQLGQKNLFGSIFFLYSDRRQEGETPTPWTPALMLERAFSPDLLPDEWASRIKLGDISALENSAAAPELTIDQPFCCANYQQFIVSVLALAGDVGIRERYETDATYLDCYPLGPSAETAQEFRVASLNESVLNGANVSALNAERDLEGVITRQIVYGALKQMIVTIGTDHENAPLVPQWGDTPSQAYTEGGVYSADEAAVLANPALAHEGSLEADFRAQEGDPPLTDIFKVFRIPAALRNYRVKNSLPLAGGDGKDRPAQVFIFDPPLLDAIIGGKPGKSASEDPEAAVPRALRISHIDPETGVIRLAEPAIYVSEIAIVNGLPQVTYEAADVYATLAIQLNTHCGYDTGAVGGDGLPNLGLDGLVDPIFRRDMEYIQFGSAGLDLTLEDDETQIADYEGRVLEDDGTITEHGSFEVLRDDRDALAAIAEGMLRANARVRQADLTELDFCASGLRVGDTTRVNRGGTSGPAMQIYSLQFRCADPSTLIYASDVVPVSIIEDASPPSHSELV